MKTGVLFLLPIGLTLTLASCGNSTVSKSVTPSEDIAAQIAQYAQRPELQDPEIQEALRTYQDAQMLEALKEGFGEKPMAPTSLDNSSADESGAQLNAQKMSRTQWLQYISWGSIDRFNSVKSKPKGYKADWSTDGCSTHGMGMGYSDTFRPACLVHDFGYRNLPDVTPSSQDEGAKARTDSVFLDNMRSICNGMDFKGRCRVTADLYYRAVRTFGEWK